MFVIKEIFSLFNIKFKGNILSPTFYKEKEVSRMDISCIPALQPKHTMVILNSVLFLYQTWAVISYKAIDRF